MPGAIDLSAVARILALADAGWHEEEIARKAGVSRRTVRRYLEDQRARRHEPRKPLYDPRRDGAEHPPSVTALICGDPPSGRRELLAQRPVRRSPHDPRRTGPAR